jgi:hypothetical protein
VSNIGDIYYHIRKRDTTKLLLNEVNDPEPDLEPKNKHAEDDYTDFDDKPLINSGG